jgi:hypothetical protein
MQQNSGVLFIEQHLISIKHDLFTLTLQIILTSLFSSHLND